MSSLIGQTLGKYKILAEIGRGGMACVYKAHQSSLNRFVAIKVLHYHLLEGEQFLERFQREARAAASLRHSNIVQVFDFDVQDDIYYMVMEYIDGMTLKDFLSRYSQSGHFLTLDLAMGIFNQVASALDYAQSYGMLHRDIKPTNILIDHSGNAYLSDFGIARMVNEKQITITGALIGTPEYMSPEQALGQTLTPASDIYSLAVTLFEILTCNVPFSAPTPMSVMQKHINQPPPPLSHYRPDLPESIEPVLLKAMAKNPQDRYQQVADFHRAVQTACQKPADDAHTIIEPQKTPIQATFVEPTPTNQQPAGEVVSSIHGTDTSPIKRNPALLVSAIVIISLLVFILSAGFAGMIKLPFFSKDSSGIDDIVIPVVLVLTETPDEAVFITEQLTQTTQVDFAKSTPTDSPSPPPPAIPTPSQEATETTVLTPIAGKPSITADKNYFCRQRPEATSEEHWIFKSGSKALLIGKSVDNWWLISVDDPSTRTKCCWVAGGSTTGDSSIVPVITYEIDRLDCPSVP